MNSISIVTVQFLSDVNTQIAIQDLKDKVDLVKTKLPKDANDPVVKEVLFSDTAIWVFSVSGNYSDFQLYNFAKKIRIELEKILPFQK